MRCIVQDASGKYLTHRRSTGRQYISRSSWSDNIDDAKIFASKSAAKNSANASNSELAFLIFSVVIAIDKLV